MEVGSSATLRNEHIRRNPHIQRREFIGMEYERSERALAVRSADLRGGTAGGIYRRERITKKMGREKSKQSQARRDSFSDLRGSLHGNKGDTEAATDPTASGIETTNTATSEPIPTEARWMGSAKVVDDRITSAMPVPRVSSFVAQPCSCCTALRPADTNYSRVVSTQGRIRYCKCTFCGNTWKEQG